MHAAVKARPSPHQYVRGSSRAAEYLVRESATSPFLRRVVGDDHHEVVVAIRPRVTSGFRAEEVDAFRVIGLDKAPDNLGKDGVVFKRFGVHRVFYDTPAELRGVASKLAIRFRASATCALS